MVAILRVPVILYFRIILKILRSMKLIWSWFQWRISVVKNCSSRYIIDIICKYNTFWYTDISEISQYLHLNYEWIALSFGWLSRCDTQNVAICSHIYFLVWDILPIWKWWASDHVLESKINKSYSMQKYMHWCGEAITKWRQWFCLPFTNEASAEI